MQSLPCVSLSHAGGVGFEKNGFSVPPPISASIFLDCTPSLIYKPQLGNNLQLNC